MLTKLVLVYYTAVLVCVRSYIECYNKKFNNIITTHNDIASLPLSSLLHVVCIYQHYHLCIYVAVIMYGKKNDSTIEHVTMIYMYYNMDVSMVTIPTATIPLLFVTMATKSTESDGGSHSYLYLTMERVCAYYLLGV